MPPSVKVQGIYLIRNTVNGKVYVGRSKSVVGRFDNHRSSLARGVHINPHLQAVWLKYGAEAFEFSILEEVPVIADLPVREGYYCDLYKALSSEFGYNLVEVSPTGQTSSAMKGRKASPETRRLQSEARKGKLSEAQRAARDKLRGVPRPAEAVRKTATANTGKKRTAETKALISKGNTGKVRTSEARARISAGHKRRYAQEELAKAGLRSIEDETLYETLWSLQDGD